MASKPNVFPSYLRHSSGQARIRVDGRDVMLGLYGSDESRIKYGQLVAKLAGGVSDAVRQQFGLEHCQSVLGHSKADMTEHYAKAGPEKAREVALKIG